MITGKWPARGIGAMHARRESDDKQCRSPYTKSRHRPGMIIRVFPADLIQEGAESRAGTTARIKSHYSISHAAILHYPGVCGTPVLFC